MRENILKYWLSSKSGVVAFLLIVSFTFFLFGINSVANIVVIILVLVTIFWRTKDDSNPDLKSLVFYLFISYFLITVLCLINSSDLSSGFKFVERRLLILLFPVIFSFNSIERNHIILIQKSIIFILVLGLLTGLVNSFLQYQIAGDSGFFYNDNLVGIIGKQAPYAAFFINSSLVLLFFGRDSFKSKWLPVVLILFLMFCQFLLAVRLSILIMVLGVVIYGVHLTLSHSYIRGILLFLIIGILSISSFYVFPQMKNRFLSMTSNWDYDYSNPNPVNHFNGEIKSENWNGVNLRIALWHCGVEIIKDNPAFGVGTGDYDKVFKEKIKEKNFVYAIQQNFGVHNQYLYTWVTFGIFGLLLFLSSLIYPGYISWRSGNFKYVGFIIIFALSLVTENILNRYFGIYFYSFLNSLLFFERRI